MKVAFVPLHGAGLQNAGVSFRVEVPLKLWLDDIRDPARTYSPWAERRALWSAKDVVWAKTASEAIALLAAGGVTRVSLDHDLGVPLDEVGTGYEVACWIEEHAMKGTLASLEWAIHSANPVGVQKMTTALMNADKFWELSLTER